MPCHGPAQLVHRQPVSALAARARVPPAAPPAPDDRRHVDQVLVELVAEEALAQLGQPALSALQGAHKLPPPVAQQDVVVGPLADEGLVVVEVPAGRPQCEEDVLPSAFEDKPLCVPRQLAELLQLSVEEVCADFDAMLRHDWRHISAEEVREFCVYFLTGIQPSSMSMDGLKM